MTESVLQTEYEFTLPQGYPDDDGEVHTDGTMRLATAADEIKPQNDPRVQSNPSYMTVILLSRVVTRLGTLGEVTPHVIENLYVNDLAHLQDLYQRINERGVNAVDAVCPECGEEFEVDVEREAPMTTGGDRPGPDLGG
jgi:phage FluMu protein gp41